MIVVFFYLLFFIMFCHIKKEEQDKAKGKVLNGYDKLVRVCERDPITLNLLTSLNKRFENFMLSDEYQVRKPYDKFQLKIAGGLPLFIVVDKNLDLKFVVGFVPSADDECDRDLFLKYCIGYGKEIDDFIRECEKTVMEIKLKKKRIEIVENIINK